MDGVGDVKHIQIKLFDNPVQMDLDKILYGWGAPVPYNQGFHMR